jgi:hypothetical protein
MLSNYTRVLDCILDLAQIEDPSKPLVVKILLKDGLGFPVKEGLLDPDNKCLQLVLWLYSIEPSIQEDLN